MPKTLGRNTLNFHFFPFFSGVHFELQEEKVEIFDQKFASISTALHSDVARRFVPPSFHKLTRPVGKCLDGCQPMYNMFVCSNLLYACLLCACTDHSGEAGTEERGRGKGSGGIESLREREGGFSFFIVPAFEEIETRRGGQGDSTRTCISEQKSRVSSRKERVQGGVRLFFQRS